MAGVLAIVGVSGSGKTHLIKALCTNRGFERIPSVTTRAPRPDEIPGIDKQFVAEPEFANREAAGELTCVAEIYGARYGHDAQSIDASSGVAVVELAAKSVDEFAARFPGAQILVVRPAAGSEAREAVSRRESDGTHAEERMAENVTSVDGRAAVFTNRYDAASEAEFIALARSLCGT